MTMNQYIPWKEIEVKEKPMPNFEDDLIRKYAEELTKAGNSFSGHVTVGSLQEQIKVIKKILGEHEEAFW